MRDRSDSRSDRQASANDRSEMSTAFGHLRLPAMIPLTPDSWKPLGDCTAGEVSTYSAALLRQSLDETHDAIEMVDRDKEASPLAKQLVRQSRGHHDDADDLVWYVNEWISTGTRPQPQRS